MGTWFDRLAKHSARSVEPTSADETAGLTRRQVIARGAVVTGAAWTAPMLMSVRPAFAGASMCPPQGDSSATEFVTCPGGTSVCCPPDQECLDLLGGGVGCSIPLDGECGNQGLGKGGATCNGGFSTCNQPGGNPAVNPSICGGPGARCNNNEICGTDLTCDPATLRCV